MRPLLLVLFVVFCPFVDAFEINTYRSDRLGFELSYSDRWRPTSAAGDPALMIERRPSSDPATISVEVRTFSGSKQDIMQELRQNPEFFIENLQARFPGAELLDSRKTYLGGFPAYLLTTLYTVKNLNIEFDIVTTQIICIHAESVYLISFETTPELYERMFEEFKSIVATFNFR